KWFGAVKFGWESLPECDVMVVVKHPLPERLCRQVPAATRIVFCPVDHYESAAQIDADRAWLTRCSRIVIHCERLRKYFLSYAPVECLDHHVKFVARAAHGGNADGPILWTGVRSNLPALVAWVNAHSLPRELVVLTNPENPSGPAAAADFGFAA